MELESSLSKLTVDQIREKISLLSSTTEGESLRYAMTDLKKALLANPTACAFLGPEDVGEMVKWLKHLVAKDVKLQDAELSKKEAKSALKKVTKFENLNPEMLKEIEDDLF